VVAQHNEQPHEQLPSDGDLGLGAPAPMHEGEVDPLEVGIHASRMGRGLPKGEAEERAALLGDVAEVIFVGRSLGPSVAGSYRGAAITKIDSAYLRGGHRLITELVSSRPSPASIVLNEWELRGNGRGNVRGIWESG